MATKTTEQRQHEATVASYREAGYQPCLVTTLHKGVFFGYVERASQPEDLIPERPEGSQKVSPCVRVSHVRMCVFWPEQNHGIVGLCSDGPKDGARIGPAAPSMDIYDVTAIMECTDEAAARWESEPWSDS